MHLLAPLAAGVKGASNGTVFVYRRGTTTAATVYADFAGKVKRVGEMRLSSHGALECYVEELVDVVVKDADNEQVRAWTDGRSSGAVVVDHDVSTEDTLAEALGNALTSFGAEDWKVLVNGEDQLVYAALHTSSGVFWSVKLRGAAGDGTGDDWGPLQGTIRAVAAAGGGVVYVPAGTYLVSGPLELPTGVSLVGAGSGATSIVANHSDASLLQLFSSSGQQVVRAIRFASEVATAEPLILNMASLSLIDACVLDGENCTGELLRMDSTGRSRISETEFFVEHTSSGAIETYSGDGDELGGRTEIANCIFHTPVSFTGSVVGIRDIHLEGCLFDVSATTTGTVKCVEAAGNSYGTVDACEVTSSGGASVVVFGVGNLNNSGGQEWAFEDLTIANTDDANLSFCTLSDSSSGYYARLMTVESRHMPAVEITTAVNSDLTHYLNTGMSQYGVLVFYNDDTTATAGASQVCLGASTTSDYSGDVQQSRECTVFYGVKTADGFTLNAPNDNRTRNSVMPGWKCLADSVHAMKMLSIQGYAQSPTVGMLTRWHCIGQSSGEPTADTSFREAYVP